MLTWLSEEIVQTKNKQKIISFFDVIWPDKGEW
jgi:hypothetical protein